MNIRSALICLGFYPAFSGCSELMEACVEQDPSGIRVELCSGNLVESILLYHLDSTSSKYVNDWQLEKSGARLTHQVWLFRENSGYEHSTHSHLPLDGHYILNINGTMQGGVVLLSLEKGRLAGVVYDSTTPCEPCGSSD